MSKLENLKKELKEHWENTKEERERTHSKAMYENFLKNKGDVII